MYIKKSEKDISELIFKNINKELALNIPDFPNYLNKIPEICGRYLLNNALGTEWFDYLILAIISLIHNGVAHLYNPITNIHQFLFWAIPNFYPNVKSISPRVVLEKAYAELSRGISIQFDKNYSILQQNVERFIKTLPAQNQIILSKYTLPKLVKNEKLRKARLEAESDAKRERKEDVADILPYLWDLYRLALTRFLWIKELVLEVEKLLIFVRDKSRCCPIEFSFRNISNTQTLKFILWDTASWLVHFPDGIQNCKTDYHNNSIFLQFIGAIDDEDWFFEAINLGMFDHSQPKSNELKKFFQIINVPLAVINTLRLFLSANDLSPEIEKIRKSAMKLNESSIIFVLEPFYLFALLGLLALSILLSTAMRVGEIMQISLDHDCMVFQQDFSMKEIDKTIITEKEFCFYLYPKNSLERKPYKINSFSYKLLSAWVRECQKMNNSKDLPYVEPGDIHKFRQSWKYAELRRFIFQIRKKQLSDVQISSSIQFLTMNSNLFDRHNKQFRITPHLIRHCVSTLLNLEGLSIEELMDFLKHLNEYATRYYGKIPEEQLISLLRPILDQLAAQTNISSTNITSISLMKNYEIEIIKGFGKFSMIPGGICTCDQFCQVEFACAGCYFYGVDINRIGEIIDAINYYSDLENEFLKNGKTQLVTFAKNKKRIWETRLSQANIEKQIQDAIPYSLGDQDEFSESKNSVINLTNAIINLLPEIEK